MRISARRQLLAGFLSGASEVVGLLLFLAVLLFVGTLGPLLYNISSAVHDRFHSGRRLGLVHSKFRYIARLYLERALAL